MSTVDHTHLIRAWHDVRQPSWPDLEACLTDPARGGIVRARAAQLAHAQAPPAATAPAPRRWPFALAGAPAGTDLKRLAAGDTDDDTDPTE